MTGKKTAQYSAITSLAGIRPGALSALGRACLVVAAGRPAGAAIPAVPTPVLVTAVLTRQ